MEVVANSYLPGDSGLVDQIVYELKSQGIFDQFRKECISDVDTKPAYQNLRQRVEGSVARFLKQQTWKPDMNKNQVREMLRKNIYESGYLETGVERIVDQVVNPKINTIFLPQVEDVVYRFLGIEKPNKNSKTEPLKIITQNDLLPTDLEAVSPESTHTDKKEEDLNLDDSLNDSKMDEDESPPFEPLEEQSPYVPQNEENSVDSHISGFSAGMGSHDSNHSADTKVLHMEFSNPDSQVSQNSSDSRLSIVTSEENTKMEICEESNHSKSFTIIADSSTTEDVTNSGSNEEIIIDKSEKSLTEPVDEKNESVKTDLTSVKKNSEDNTKKSEDKSKSRSSDKHKSRDKDKKDDRDKKTSSSNSRDKEHKSRHSSSSKDDRSKDRKDHKSSSSSSKDREKSKSDKDKNGKDKDKHKSSSSSTSNRHSSSSSTNRDKSNSKTSSSSSSKDKEKSRSSSNYKDNKSKSEDKSRDSSKPRSSSSSDRYKKDEKSNGKHSTSSSSKKDKDRKRDSKKDKDDHYSYKVKKDHRRSTDRDSNDGHSNKHNTSSNGAFSSSSSQQKSSQESSESASNGNGSGDSGNSDQTEQNTTVVDNINDPVIDNKSIMLHETISITEVSNVKLFKPKIANNIHEAIRLTKIRRKLKEFSDRHATLSNTDNISTESNNVNQTEQNSTVMDNVAGSKVKLYKPKFASNIFEAKRLMKIRRKLKKLENESELGVVSINAATTTEDENLTEGTATISQEKWDALEAKLLNTVNEDYSYNKSTDEEELEEIPNVKKLDTVNIEDKVTECVESDKICLEKYNNFNNCHKDGTKIIWNNTFHKSEDGSDNRSVEECEYMEKPDIKQINDLKYLNAFVNKLEMDIKHISPNGKLSTGVKRKRNENERNNNLKKEHYEEVIASKRSRTSLPSKANSLKVKNTIDISANANFPLPLSPAESDQSNDKKDYSPDLVSLKPKTKNGAKSLSNQRYSSDDLYKPRPIFTSSRRRGAKNKEVDN